MIIRARYRNRNGFLTVEENQTLSDYEADHGLYLNRRPTMEENAEELLRLHRERENPCKWWRAGRGILVNGEWVESPAIIMSKHEERR